MTHTSNKTQSNFPTKAQNKPNRYKFFILNPFFYWFQTQMGEPPENCTLWNYFFHAQRTSRCIRTQVRTTTSFFPKKFQYEIRADAKTHFADFQTIGPFRAELIELANPVCDDGSSGFQFFGTRIRGHPVWFPDEWWIRFVDFRGFRAGRVHLFFDLNDFFWENCYLIETFNKSYYSRWFLMLVKFFCLQYLFDMISIQYWNFISF